MNIVHNIYPTEINTVRKVPEITNISCLGYILSNFLYVLRNRNTHTLTDTRIHIYICTHTLIEQNYI